MTDGLPKIAPSINTQRFPIADGASFIQPVTLRNLSPDHTLVLVNGTRRHRSPLVNLQFAPKDSWGAVLYINNVGDENANLSFDRERGGRACT
jgi:hypothetical protein